MLKLLGINGNAKVTGEDEQADETGIHLLGRLLRGRSHKCSLLSGDNRACELSDL
jgi:hypothetical protein